MTPEFSRPHRLDRIGAGESTVAVEATADERAALARRFGLVALDRIAATYALRRDSAGVHARGRLSAAATQACVATGVPLPVTVDEEFELRFLPEPETEAEEIELDAGACDTVFYAGGTIDGGEAAAETLVLALDPFPRSSEAAQALKEAGVLSEEEAGPFGALAELKEKLKRGG